MPVLYVAVCSHLTDRFPFPMALEDAEPVVEYLNGWKEDISHIRTWEKLPDEAKAYVKYIEKAIDCPITYISVGAERDSIIYRKGAVDND